MAKVPPIFTSSLPHSGMERRGIAHVSKTLCVMNFESDIVFVSLSAWYTRLNVMLGDRMLRGMNMVTYISPRMGLKPVTG